jgi:zinc transport system permease protein
VQPTWADLFQSFELFRDPILCAMAAGLVLGFLGVFVVLRRMVFVTAAISQSAGLGVALAFYAEIHLGLAVDPVVGAVTLALGSMLLFALPVERLRLSRESFLGAAYIAAGAGAVMVGDRISQEAHDIAGILFGTAVLVRAADLYLVAGIGLAVTLVHVVWYRGFLFAAFDPDGARVQGVPVRFLDSVMWVMLALVVSFATRALGVLPVFAFAVLPAMAALLVGLRPAWSMVIAGIFGAFSGVAGYIAAYFFALPVGACQAGVAVAIFLLLLPVRSWKKGS